VKVVNSLTDDKTMEILDIIQTVCSVLGLIITIVLSHQVISIKNIIGGNSNNVVNQKGNNVIGKISGRDITKQQGD